jgi:hypothetical protein
MRGRPSAEFAFGISPSITSHDGNYLSTSTVPNINKDECATPLPLYLFGQAPFVRTRLWVLKSHTQPLVALPTERGVFDISFFANLPGFVPDKLAAIITAFHERVADRLYRPAAGHKFGQNYSVFDCHRGALRCVRTRSMGRVADQQGSVSVPWRWKADFSRGTWADRRSRFDTSPRY